PADVRRDAAPLPPDAPDGARRVAPAPDGPLRRRHLPDGRADQRRLVHDELRAHVRDVADRLPRGASAGVVAGPRPDLRAARIRPSGVQQFWRRQARGPELAWWS